LGRRPIRVRTGATAGLVEDGTRPAGLTHPRRWSATKNQYPSRQSSVRRQQRTEAVMGADIHTLAGAYALHALPELERARFQRHLAGCQPCRSDCDELFETAARLSAVTSVRPRTALRAQVLAVVARTRQHRGTGRTPPSRPGWQLWTAAGIAAAVAALGASVAQWSAVQEELRRERAVSAPARQTADLLAAADAKVRSKSLVGGGQATVISSVATNGGVVLLRDLPDPGEGRVYQLWLVHQGRPMSCGVLASGIRDVTVGVGGVAGAATFALSRERVGGSATPSTIVDLVDLT
jgi:hypothetical protein